jgi:hypothetical protein
MVMNLGYIELGGGGVTIRVYYDTAFSPVGDDQPLVDGPRGWCLDMTNTTGKSVKLTVYGVTGTAQVITVAQGDPVTSGPASGRSRTAAQMAALGFTTRGNVGTITLE